MDIRREREKERSLTKKGAVRLREADRQAGRHRDRLTEKEREMYMKTPREKRHMSKI